MRRNQILLLLLTVTSLSFFSCKKDKDKPQPTTVRIDGKDYPIVTIGNQTWMAANYSGTTGVYYDNDINNAAGGKFYTKEEAKALVPPAGWRLPSYEDYVDLFKSQGVNFSINGNAGFATQSDKLRPFMSINGWIGGEGTNTTGFNMQPVGFYEDGEFSHKGGSVSYWTSNELPPQRYYFGIFNTAEQPIAYYGPIGTDQKFPVRFVKNK
ncbi:MAG TPA: FISUMP domain-containing protein [Flavisolibacter sp.]|nr:FISUMP domain-containing protein [Flavisolibacter sp.]